MDVVLAPREEWPNRSSGYLLLLTDLKGVARVGKEVHLTPGAGVAFGMSQE